MNAGKYGLKLMASHSREIKALFRLQCRYANFPPMNKNPFNSDSNRCHITGILNIGLSFPFDLLGEKVLASAGNLTAYGRAL